MSKKTARIFLFLVTIGLIPMPVRADAWDDIGKPLAIGGALIAGVGGLIGLGSWLASETDQELLNRSRTSYQQIRTNHNPLIVKLENAYNITGSYLNTQVVRTVNEPLLYDFAGEFVRLQQDASSYTSQLNNDISELRSLSDRLQRRMNELRTASYQDFSLREMVQQMHAIRETIRSGLPHVELLRDYLAEHKTYFVIYDTEHSVRKKYSRELAVLSNGYYDRILLLDEIKFVVMANQSYERQMYPYLHYVARLEEQIAILEQSLKRPAYNYADRIGWARWVLDNLLYVKSLIIAADAYAQEWRDRERAALEREQLNVLREHADAERRTAQALEEKNRLKREELEKKERELRQRYGGAGRKEQSTEFSIKIYG